MAEDRSPGYSEATSKSSIITLKPLPPTPRFTSPFLMPFRRLKTDGPEASIPIVIVRLS